MAKWRRKGPKGFVKNFIAAQKATQAGGGNAFGSAPSTPTWICPDCKAVVLGRRETCDCGTKKPADDPTADS